MPDELKPANSHVALNTIVDDDGEEQQIVRFNMPFGRVGAGEFGTYFIGYARSPDVIEQMLTNMFIGKPPGTYDRILDFSTAVTGNLFFVPTADFLDDPPSAAAAPAEADAPPADAADVPGDGSLAIGSLREDAVMNHLLREHAPITESTWELLDEEARDRLKPALATRRLVDFSGPHGWEHSATNLGRTEPLGSPPSDDVSGLRRRVLPLVELRADFELSRAELRDADRGADDADLAPLDDAAHQIAVAENIAVFHGWQGAINGIAESSPHAPIPLPGSADSTRRRSPPRSSSSWRAASRVPTGSRSAGSTTAR